MDPHSGSSDDADVRVRDQGRPLARTSRHVPCFTRTGTLTGQVTPVVCAPARVLTVADPRGRGEPVGARVEYRRRVSEVTPLRLPVVRVRQDSDRCGDVSRCHDYVS